jgi:hypothetical protein
MATPANKGSVWESLTSDERVAIEAAFKPLGDVSAESLTHTSSGLGALVGHLKKSNLRHLGYRLIAVSEHLLPKETDPVRLHFYFQAIGQFFYRFRNDDDFALGKAIEAFEKQAGLSSRVGPILAKSIGLMPSHAGFDQLRIIH